MEILVRRNDLVKELQLVQGIVERKNSIPILSNVLAEARSGELRISATDLDVSLRCGCAAQVVEEGAVTLGAKKLYEIVRSLPESDVQREGARATPGRGSSASGSSSRWPASPGRTSRRLPEARRGQGGRDPGRRPAGAHPAHRVRDHGGGRALLPRGSAPRARQGRGVHGGDRRPPPGLGPEEGGAQGGGDHPRPRARARPSPSSPASSRTWAGRRRLVPAGRRAPRSSPPGAAPSRRRWWRRSSRPSRRWSRSPGTRRWRSAARSCRARSAG